MCSSKPSSLPGLGDSDACQNLRTTGIVDVVDQHFKNEVSLEYSASSVVYNKQASAT